MATTSVTVVSLLVEKCDVCEPVSARVGGWVSIAEWRLDTRVVRNPEQHASFVLN